MYKKIKRFFVVPLLIISILCTSFYSLKPVEVKAFAWAIPAAVEGGTAVSELLIALFAAMGITVAVGDLQTVDQKYRQALEFEINHRYASHVMTPENEAWVSYLDEAYRAGYYDLCPDWFLEQKQRALELAIGLTNELVRIREVVVNGENYKVFVEKMQDVSTGLSVFWEWCKTFQIGHTVSDQAKIDSGSEEAKPYYINPDTTGAFENYNPDSERNISTVLSGLGYPSANPITDAIVNSANPSYNRSMFNMYEEYAGCIYLTVEQYGSYQTIVFLMNSETTFSWSNGAIALPSRNSALLDTGTIYGSDGKITYNADLRSLKRNIPYFDTWNTGLFTTWRGLSVRCDIVEQYVGTAYKYTDLDGNVRAFPDGVMGVSSVWSTADAVGTPSYIEVITMPGITVPDFDLTDTPIIPVLDLPTYENAIDEWINDGVDEKDIPYWDVIQGGLTDTQNENDNSDEPKIPVVSPSILNFLSSLFDGLLDVLKSILDAILSIPSYLVSIWEAIKAIPDWLSNAWNSLRDWFGNVISEIGLWGSALGQSFLDLPLNLWNSLTSFLSFWFVPDGVALEGVLSSLNFNFPFIVELKDFITNLIAVVFTPHSAVPVFTFPFSKARFSAFKFDDVTVDMGWYEEFKPMVDLFSTAFFFLFFGWRMYRRLPDMLNSL